MSKAASGKEPRAFRLDDPSVDISLPRGGDAGPPPPGRGRVVVEEEPLADIGGDEPIDQDLLPPPAEEERRAELALGKRVFGWGGLLISAVGGLVTLWLVTSLEQFIADLLSRNPVLGYVALALAGLAVLALLVLAGREIAAILRGKAIAALKARAEDVLTSDDPKAGRAVLSELVSIYAARPETARPRARLRETETDIIDGADLVRLAERELMAPLDREARIAVARAAKRVSVVTAISPRALVDVLFVAGQALRLVRTISAVYGGRPGFFGFMRLLRAVSGHLVITGGMAMGDSLVQQVLGAGLAARLSARLGEGVFNGLLTARIGLSAIAVCRPLPFAALPAPGVKDVAGFLFEGDAAKSSR
ncbi:MAG: TIGR01620 family protein [Alsobacter sp.]